MFFVRLWGRCEDLGSGKKTRTYKIILPPFSEFWDEHVEFGESFSRPLWLGLLEALVGVMGDGDRTFNGPDCIDGENSFLQLLA